MKLIKTANKVRLKLTKAEWQTIGKKAQWLTQEGAIEEEVYCPAHEYIEGRGKGCRVCKGKMTVPKSVADAFEREHTMRRKQEEVLEKSLRRCDSCKEVLDDNWPHRMCANCRMSNRDLRIPYN